MTAFKCEFKNNRPVKARDWQTAPLTMKYVPRIHTVTCHLHYGQMKELDTRIKNCQSNECFYSINKTLQSSTSAIATVLKLVSNPYHAVPIGNLQ